MVLSSKFLRCFALTTLGLTQVVNTQAADPRPEVAEIISLAKDISKGWADIANSNVYKLITPDPEAIKVRKNYRIQVIRRKDSIIGAQR